LETPYMILPYLLFLFFIFSNRSADSINFGYSSSLTNL
jgi:hypothetical protein